MRAVRKLIGLFLITSMILRVWACGGVAESDNDSIVAFSAAVIHKQKESGFLDRWNETDIEDFNELLVSFGFYPAEGVIMHTAQHGLQYAYEQVWGTAKAWTLEQQYEYAEFEMNCGLQDRIIQSFPDEDDLSLEAARELAQKSIRGMGDVKNYDGAAIDFGTLVESYHFWEYPEEGRVWVFEYYDIDAASPTYTASLYQNGTQPHIDYYDADEMYNVYIKWYYSRGFEHFRFWSIDDQYEFHQCLLGLYDRQMERYGNLPGIAKLVLKNQYIRAQDGMISEMQAITAAEAFLEEKIPLSDEDAEAMRTSVSLYENADGIQVFAIGFAKGNEVLYCIEVDAHSGESIGMVD